MAIPTIGRRATPQPSAPGHRLFSLWVQFSAWLNRAQDVWVVCLLAALALASRLFVNPQYASNPSSDEYYYGLYAIDFARSLAHLSLVELNEFASESRSIALLTGLALAVIPTDAISLGRLLQVTFNALTVPLVYLLGRAVGLGALGSFAATALYLAMPEPWREAWRFWPDSQVTFLAAACLLSLVPLARRLSFKTSILPALLFLAALLTKESTALALVPAIMVAVILGAGQPAPVQIQRRAAFAAAGFAGVVVVFVAAAAVAADSLRSIFAATPFSAPVHRTLFVAEEIMSELSVLAGGLTGYVAGVGQQLTPAEFGVGLSLFLGLGGLVLAAVLVRAARRAWRLPSQWRAALCLLALLVWIPGIALGVMLLADLAVGAPVVAAVSLALVLLALSGAVWPGRSIAVGISANDDATQVPSALIITGTFLAVFVALRYVVWVAPGLDAVFTPRTFHPIYPVLAVLAGWGMVYAASGLAVAVARLASRSVGVPRAPVLIGLLAVTLLVLSPITEHLGPSPIGRLAAREGDLQTPGGLRITALVEAERWLAANLLPTDRVLTSMPRHLAWHAGTGVNGYLNALDVGRFSMERPDAALWPERRMHMMGLVAQALHLDYVADFNLAWTMPESAAAGYWYAFYEWLRTRPELEEVYLRHDPHGRVVFYVFRNHRSAASPTYVDREQARADGIANFGLRISD